MSWLLLALTIVLELAGTTMMKLSEGFTRLWPSVGVIVCYTGAIVGVTLALRELELSVAYAVWAGAGTALAALVGILVFKESATALKALSLLLVVTGIVGLHLASGADPR
ncbi:MAG: multidrug efflux SMR transporter [Pseudomonadota bacterium]